ncbi:aconitase [Epibacterium ulvae]|uniref:Aconitate hydratase A n=1 Tax=Epibacterium ulvae TaxID=1156985 RepID=A0A1G5QZF7_9RHOB|nr:aconitate hydratase AcnA [Epibacterium ulvae]SCZ67193.1 aconitase [Epibacterium ulvae]
MFPQKSIQTPSQSVQSVDLLRILGDRLPRLPHVLRLLAENHVRAGASLGDLHVALDGWLAGKPSQAELSFRPNRILMHDTTCTPALADIAGLRDAVTEAGGDPSSLTPTLPVEVSVDHSLAVDVYAQSDASVINRRNEITRNRERYAFMKWASVNMDGVTVNPPGTGIMHTINLEQLATLLVMGENGFAHPDMLLGTDSHTPMINGIGVLAWGIGGLEAESVMFGRTVSLAVPEVVGVELTGALKAGVTPTDLALVITQKLREIGVAGNFVEFFGAGVSTLSADARSVIANMAPEYGASTGFFPADEEVVSYLRRTDRPDALTGSIEPVFKAMGLWFDPAERPRFDRSIVIDLDSIGTNIAGPRRPQDCCAPKDARASIEKAIGRELKDLPVGLDRDVGEAPDGAIGVAAITSCTNTSDPRLLVSAGLLARKARAFGLRPPHWVKTSLAPGSPSARAYLERAELMEDLDSVGFSIVGFGCTTCIGNPGPLPEVIEHALREKKAIPAILSGNRNFPGRVHPKLDLGYLASPPLVVSYALKGTIQGDILSDPIGQSTDGKDVYLTDIWPDEAEINAALTKGFKPTDVPQAFSEAWRSKQWDEIKAPKAAQFPWSASSRYLRRPKFASLQETSRLGHYQAAPLLVLGDDMTTDHISPAGWIDPNSEAGHWLIEREGDPKDLNVYAAYRGNWEVMVRGLFTNRLATNYLSQGLAPPETVLEDGSVHSVYAASQILAERRQPVVILAGERYGMGSSRDWAAKGVALLGARAIIANGFERIHRTNLIGMGVLPLQIIDDFVPKDAGVTAADRLEVSIANEALTPLLETEVILHAADGPKRMINCRVAVETWQEVDTLRKGGILPAILQETI